MGNPVQEEYPQLQYADKESHAEWASQRASL